MEKQMTLKQITYKYHDERRYRCSICHNCYYHPNTQTFSGRHIRKHHLKSKVFYSEESKSKINTIKNKERVCKSEIKIETNFLSNLRDIEVSNFNLYSFSKESFTIKQELEVISSFNSNIKNDNDYSFSKESFTIKQEDDREIIEHIMKNIDVNNKIEVEGDGNCFYHCMGEVFKRDSGLIRDFVAYWMEPNDYIKNIPSICYFDYKCLVSQDKFYAQTSELHTMSRKCNLIFILCSGKSRNIVSQKTIFDVNSDYVILEYLGNHFNLICYKTKHSFEPVQPQEFENPARKKLCISCFTNWPKGYTMGMKISHLNICCVDMERGKRTLTNFINAKTK